ncbi:MAG TPA: 5'-methylthioadenosine/adenosylhomocysteine nucleosidase [Anaerolineales bacterium]|nr:5'-methylthioadenosine/adenosylhomocysteine nucleosidase [Anaerolineales bacterium]
MKIGLIGAMDEELIPIRAILHHLEKIEKGNRTFWKGDEYGHEITLTRCDPGKVNAVIATQQMLDHFSVDAIFNMGSSGALHPALEVGDLVIGSEFIQHDFDVTDWGLKPGEMLFDIVISGDNGQMQFRTQQIFSADPALAQLALEVAQQIELASLNGHAPKTFTGRILSGDQFISKTEKARSLWETHQGLCTDMEAAAIAQACEVNHVPFLCIRAISDKADHSAVITFTDFLMGATANYGRIFESIFKQS